jgi:ornithine cyclodeaminase/alanine dehydrogenase-like protein (mu-crystallin family)
MALPAEPTLILTDVDLRQLRESLGGFDGPLDAVERATLTAYRDGARKVALADDVAIDGGTNSFRVSVAGGDGLATGMRVFGNPPHTRIYMLFDGETRRPLALMDWGVLNSVRVAAIAGLAARHLAPANAKSLGLIGSGWQAPTQVRMLKHVLPSLESIRVFSPTVAHREASASEMSDALGIDVTPVGSPEEAVRGMDVVDLLAPGHYDHRDPLLEAGWVKPGALVISTAGNQSTQELVDRSRIVVGSWQALADDPSPRLPYTPRIRSGAFTQADVMELGAILAGDPGPRQAADEIVIYELTPMYVHDLFLATWAYERYRDSGDGVRVTLAGEG